MAQAVHGKKIIFLYRVLGSTSDATRIAFTKDNGETISKDGDTTATKDGVVRTPGDAEIEVTTTSILAKGDKIISELREAMLENKLIEVWKANLEEPGISEGTYKGTYYQAYLTELEESSPSDDWVEESLTFGINGTGADGDVTVAADQLDEATYVFKDTKGA
jgi:TP901-1 family phage major tail protein